MAALISAILLAIFSMLVSILIFPTLCWHVQRGNIGAASATAWIMVMNLIIFANALLWPDDDLANRYQGQVLCDIQVKIQLASQVGLPASFACILRALAHIMNMEHLSMGSIRSEKRREIAINLICCVFFPCMQMLFHYIVQEGRYYIAGVSGCLPGVSDGWATVFLIYVPPTIWDLICTYYAVLILIRLHKYKQSLQSVLARSNTNRSGFFRLFLIGLLWILASIPIQTYTLYINLSFLRQTTGWSQSAAVNERESIVLVPTGGTVVYDRFVWLFSGIAMFIFFGLSKDARDMYSSWLKHLRFHNLGAAAPPRQSSEAQHAILVDASTAKNAQIAITLQSLDEENMVAGCATTAGLPERAL